jgi:transglutaminase-like putative cysteine protease
MDSEYLQSDIFIDCDTKEITAFGRQFLDASCRTPSGMAIKLYYAVRDGIAYDPYAISDRPEDYRASHILRKRRGFCVQKAVLLCALARATGIPARLGFATVGNHLASRMLLKFTGSPVFVFHGYTELWLDERWIKATPTFNAELCNRYNVPPLEFNGREDTLFQAYNAAQKPFMDYLSYHGTYATVPLPEMLDAWERFYGKERVRGWFDPQRTVILKERRKFSQETPFIPE